MGFPALFMCPLMNKVQGEGFGLGGTFKSADLNAARRLKSTPHGID